MEGPFKSGGSGPTIPSGQPSPIDGLIVGKFYIVSEVFVDDDGDEHKVGEQWQFIGSTFSKFDDLVTICVRAVNGEEWRIPLLWKSKGQRDVIDNWKNYFSIKAIKGARLD